MQICFVVANAQSPLIGLPDPNDNKTIVHTGDKPYIEQFGYNEQLHFIGQHLHIAAIALPGFHTPNEIQFDNTVQTRYSPTASTSLIGDMEEPNQQANAPRQLRQPPQPKKQEQGTASDTFAIQILVPNVCQNLRATDTSPQRNTQRTINPTLGLCLHQSNGTNTQEVAGKHNLDKCGDNNRTLPCHTHNKQRTNKVSIDAIEEVRHGEWVWPKSTSKPIQTTRPTQQNQHHKEGCAKDAGNTLGRRKGE
eukprot:606106-Amphidinium_carterae.1